MRVWHNGCAPAFQAGYTGSTPVTRSNLVGFPSGQRGQTVNLLAPLSMVRIHLPPPFFKFPPSVKGGFFLPIFFIKLRITKLQQSVRSFEEIPMRLRKPRILYQLCTSSVPKAAYNHLANAKKIPAVRRSFYQVKNFFQLFQVNNTSPFFRLMSNLARTCRKEKNCSLSHKIQ